jgi:hypothetical protein
MWAHQWAASCGITACSPCSMASCSSAWLANWAWRTTLDFRECVFNRVHKWRVQREKEIIKPPTLQINMCEQVLKVEIKVGGMSREGTLSSLSVA